MSTITGVLLAPVRRQARDRSRSADELCSLIEELRRDIAAAMG